MANIGNLTINVRPKVDTEPLEALRTMHLRLAQELAEAIDRLSRMGEEGEQVDANES
jgi:hypothetical protein